MTDRLDDSATPRLLRRERMLAWMCGALIFLLFCTTFGSIGAAVLALNARQDVATRSTNRITGLQRDLAMAREEIAALQAQNAEANTKLDAIARQVELLGEKPIVEPTPTVERAGTRAAATPAPTTTAPARPGPSPTTTQPPRDPTPEPGAPPPRRWRRRARADDTHPVPVPHSVRAGALPRAHIHPRSTTVNRARPDGCLWWWVRYLAASALVGLVAGHAGHHLSCATTFRRRHRQ